MSDAGVCELELRLLGTKDGVEAMARTGRDEVRRNGAGVVRACTEVGRRGWAAWPVDWNVCRCEVGPILVGIDGGPAGAVTERLTWTLIRNGAGPEFDVREDNRRGAILDWSVCCC
jgi:hypothetical protein